MRHRVARNYNLERMWTGNLSKITIELKKKKIIIGEQKDELLLLGIMFLWTIFRISGL